MYFYRNSDGSYQTSNLALDDSNLTEITPEEYAAAVDAAESEETNVPEEPDERDLRIEELEIRVEELEAKNAELARSNLTLQRNNAALLRRTGVNL